MSFRYGALSRAFMQPIATALMANQHLKVLNLWGNRLDDASMRLFGPVLAEHAGLQYLGLGRNFISHEGLHALQEYIAVVVDDPTQAREKIKEQEATKPQEPILDHNGREKYRLARGTKDTQ